MHVIARRILPCVNGGLSISKRSRRFAGRSALVRESRADFPGEGEMLLVVAVIANQQRHQAHARYLRIGKSADDELLPARSI